MWKNFLLHVVNLFDFSLLQPDIVQRTLWQLYMLKEDLEMSGLQSVTTGYCSADTVAVVHVKGRPRDVGTSVCYNRILFSGHCGSCTC